MKLRTMAITLMAVAALAGGCKKKKKVEPQPDPHFQSTPNAVSEGTTTPKCENFAQPDSAKTRKAAVMIAEAQAKGDLTTVECFLEPTIKDGLKAGSLKLDLATAKGLAEGAPFMPFDKDAARANPPHWATKLPAEATMCHSLAKDGQALTFCSINGVFKLVQIEASSQPTP